jgi:EAL domain-containing protein (putative c-di-GMP-specific phosphodiesterase class I)
MGILLDFLEHSLPKWIEGVGFILTFDRLLREKQFFHMYQPLFSLSNWDIYGYEGLFRSEFCMNPEDVFRLAKTNGRLYELDTQSLFQALLTFSKYRKNNKNLIFVNVFPSTLSNPSFFYFLEQSLNQITIPYQRIVLEINEGETIEDIKAFRQIVFRLKNYGFLIAIDDLGKGFSKIQRVIELEPNFIKLDRYFSVDLSLSTQKQRLIPLVMDFCKGCAETILEGIEEPKDLATAKLLGVSIAQGFLLGKPGLLSEVNTSLQRFNY